MTPRPDPSRIGGLAWTQRTRAGSPGASACTCWDPWSPASAISSCTACAGIGRRALPTIIEQTKVMAARYLAPAFEPVG